MKNWKKYISLCLAFSMVASAAMGMGPERSKAAEGTGAVSGGSISSGSAVSTTTPVPTTLPTVTPSATPDLDAYRLPATTLKARGGSKRVRLTWTAISGASGYYVYYRKASESAYVKGAAITQGTTTTYTKKSLEQGVEYYFCIAPYKTVNGTNVEGSLSSSVLVKTVSVAATSKKAEKYATKTSFQKSKTYKTYKRMRSYMNYSKSFAIPGMINTNVAGFGSTTMVPQGMCLAGSYFLITAYDYKKTDYSVIYVVSRAAKSYITTIVLPSKAKVGGIAYDGKNVWISKGTSVASFPYTVITDAVNGGSSYTELAAYNSVHKVNGTASYMGYYNGTLWVGSFKQTSSSMVGYTVGKTTVPTLSAKYTMAVPAKTQGITFNSNGTLLLTRSYRTAKSKSGYISQIRTYIPSYSAVGAKGNIKKNTARAVTTLPPMVEGVAVYGTYTYTLFSSTYYKSCKYPTDRVIAMKTNKLL